MVLRRLCDSYARLATILALAVIAVMMTGTPLHAASNSPDAPAVRAEELYGYLADQGDMHYLGLEPVDGVESIVITLAYRAPDGTLVYDGVNFMVLAEEGLRAYLSGTPLDEAAAVNGSMLRADAEGTIAQATLRVDQPGGYTVIVQNRWQAPISYILTVHGGTLIDEGGQTLLRVPSGMEMAAPSNVPESGRFPQRVEEEPVQAMPDIQPEIIDRGDEGAGMARQISGNLQPLNDRHYFGLQPASAEGEITVNLTYETGSQIAPDGTVNFWVLTQDSLRQVIQGALPMELNLATGRPSESRPEGSRRGEMTATLRLGGQGAYTLIVFNESAVPADYAVVVEGATLVDVYGFASAGKVVASEQASDETAMRQTELLFLGAEAMTAFWQP